MAFLSVSAPPFNCCIARANPNEIKQDFFSKLWKRSNSHHRHDSPPVCAVSASSSFSRDLAKSGAAASGPREVYQPFRPPPQTNPALQNLSVEEQLQILRERRGLWFDYAIHIPALIRAGFTPSLIDEATGMTGVEQNKIVVASQVRSSLQSSGMDAELLAFFDVSGDDYLYELRILSAQQRKAAAEFGIARKMDPKEYRELARAMKDYERRKREEGWEFFSASPGDCMAYACYRWSKEVKSDEEKKSILKNGLQYASSEKAIAKLKGLLEKEKEEEQEELQAASRLQVVRLTSMEAGSQAIPFVLPVVEPNVADFEASPSVSRKGPFTIQYADSAWKSWVALPTWEPLTSSVQPVAISYPNASPLPWKPKNQKELEEPLIVVADKHAGNIDPETYYIVQGQNGNLELQLGTVVSETGSPLLGKVVLALRPPLPQQESVLDDIDWD